ncbi:MAG TPA: DegT/DnrJ/EryC1/StrS family aminotransferase [Thermoanaerobaculia bacterium]|nr:DegT/DnrJ/EryC1/StrS family aminotransferase [Thermoanaerobaculia bacterium]
MNIRPFRPDLGMDEEAAVLEALRRGELAVGPDIEAFEHELATYVGVDASAAVSSGFASLHLALLALGVREGDEVIVPCVSTCAAIRDATHAARAVPVFADTNRDDFNLAPDDVRAKITPRTRAIIAPHHIGVVSRMEELNALGVPVIEDCAQAIGAKQNGEMVGSLSQLSVFSFYATKLLTTVDGGAVASRNVAIVERVRDIRYYAGKWDSAPRFNYKMQNLGAALGRVQLRNLDHAIARRRAIGDAYLRALPDATMAVNRDRESVVYRFAFRVAASKQTAIREALEREGVPARGEVAFLTADRAAFPAADQLSKEVLTLPTYPAMTETEVEHASAALARVLHSCA